MAALGSRKVEADISILHCVVAALDQSGSSRPPELQLAWSSTRSKSIDVSRRRAARAFARRAVTEVRARAATTPELDGVAGDGARRRRARPRFTRHSQTLTARRPR